MQLEAQLADRNVTIELSSAAKEWLASAATTGSTARGRWPASSRSTSRSRSPRSCCSARLVKGGAVKVGMKDGALDFEVTEAAAPAAVSRPGGGDESGTEKEPEEVE